MTTSTLVFTDGACERNPGGRGGLGMGGRREHLRPGRRSRRPRTSGWRSVRRWRRSAPCRGPLTVWSDSRYVVDCFQKSWWRKLADERLGELQEGAGEEPRPLGAVRRAGGYGRRLVRVGEGALGGRPQRGGGPARERRHAGRVDVGAARPRRDGRRRHRGRCGRWALRGQRQVECAVQGVR